MSFYLDTNVIVAILTPESFSDRAEQFARANPEGLLVSDFAAAEYASVIARRVRTRELPVGEARDALIAFDIWRARSARAIQTTGSDIATAETYLRRLDLPLLTPDAIHSAVVQRLGAALVTFYQRMASSARALGMAVTIPLRGCRLP